MNSKHVTYPMRFGSDGKYLKPIFGEEGLSILHSVTHMECFPYWYRFFVKSFPSRPWPLTINERPFTIASKDYRRFAPHTYRGQVSRKDPGRISLFQHIEPQVPNTDIFAGNQNLHICVNIDARQDRFPETSLRAMVQDVTEIFSSHPDYPKVMEVMLTMDERIVVSLGWEIDLKSKANQLPGYIACCEVVDTGVDDTSHERWSHWGSRQLTDHPWPGHVSELPLFPGTKLRGSKGVGNLRGKGDTPRFAVTVSSGVLIKNQKDQHLMTTAARIVHPGDVVGMRETSMGLCPFARLLGEVPDDALPWDTIVSLATRWPPFTKGIIVAKSVRVVRNPATTHYRVYHWAWTGQPEDKKGPNLTPEDKMVRAAAKNETGVVTGLLHSNKHGLWAGYSVMSSANELVDAGYSSVR
ncbi:hypothetical protein FOVG_07616 [Fusarium oxysporum f. sp. pisi HDV247]|uniref:Uncharacterized protein n=1 Tax=Fusarium oxysporum f. sp. pisi HDV247 TaxID=1080344 RepID=W9PBC9_FUSOX|nr:hypothetical protein FOVG_07616 [Fusarium oxysporum f. sp. pisi HDV247]